MDKRPGYLLPENVRPKRYDVWLQPYFENFTFRGTNVIDLEIREPVEEIVLHAADLKITTALLVTDEEDKKCNDVRLNSDNQTATFNFGKLEPCKATLYIDFTGEMNDQLCGLYRSVYKNADGKDCFMATTQCEAIDARRIFPCWDEPDVKAKIQLRITIPENLTAISNMPIMGEDPIEGGWKDVLFGETPPMSTYLFALMIGEFEWVEGKTKDGVLVRICTTPGKKELGKFALNQAINVLEYYNEYFGVPYPLPKADLIAIPDFAAGAMENWGADTFRETALLVDPKNSSVATHKRVVNVIDHELAHQWHGDLVTMRYWNGLWLNEGFASWMELIAALKLHPDWNPEDQFIAEDFLAALSADALNSSRPVHNDMASEKEISEAFDAIAYSKGASVIRMLENFLGPEIFRRGLSQYMKKHAYGNTEPEDLWDTLEEVSGKPVRRMMDMWVKQAGYPVLRAKKLRSAKNKPTILELSQERFLLERNESSKTDSLWSVPVGVISEKNRNRSFTLLENKTAQISLPNKLGKEEWFKLNASHTGFFRVHYEPKDLLKFKNAISSQTLSVADRIELADDTFALSKAGYYLTDIFLELASFYVNEENHYVWETLLARLGAIERLIAKEPYREKFKLFVNKLVRSAAHKLGWEEKTDESHHNKILRGSILGTFGESGDEETIAKAREKFEAYVQNPESLNPNLRRAVKRIVASHGDYREHEIMRTLYEKATLQEEQMRLLGALTDFSKEHLLLETLQYFISGKVRSQDVYMALRGISANAAGRDITWKFVKENWGVFTKMYEKGKLIKYVIDVARPLATFEDEADVRSFFEANPVAEAERTIAQSLESIRINARWLVRDREKIGKWLEKRYS